MSWTEKENQKLCQGLTHFSLSYIRQRIHFRQVLLVSKIVNEDKWNGQDKVWQVGHTFLARSVRVRGEAHCVPFGSFQTRSWTGAHESPPPDACYRRLASWCRETSRAFHASFFRGYSSRICNPSPWPEGHFYILWCSLAFLWLNNGWIEAAPYSWPTPPDQTIHRITKKIF